MCSKSEVASMAKKLFEDYDADSSGTLDRDEVKNIF